MRCKARTALAGFGLFIAQLQAIELSGVVQANLTLADDANSFINDGTDILRFDESDFNAQQAVLRAQQDLGSSFTLDVVANYYQDGEQNIGFSQAQLLYKPLSQNTVKFKARAGFFYPAMSLENVDLGWLSPFTYTQSAINSWIGEELRTAGLELSLYSPGRARRSPWSWAFHAAAFKGNDPLGTVISWRGFAMHDRQSLNNDRLNFAPYPTVVDQDIIWHPSWVEPFHEIDGRVGFYIGAHLDYFKQSSFRYYYYDNMADPLALNDQRLYGWRTKFHSFAAQHKITADTRIVSQLMTGSTAMGDRFVYADFDAFYLMLSHKIDKHRVSFRFDRFRVQEDDIIPIDINSSDGFGFTLAWRYSWRENWQFGVEQHYNKNRAQNRTTLGLPPETEQSQTLVVLQYRWK